MGIIDTTHTLPRDANGEYIQLADAFSMVDATGTPQVSPIATNTTECSVVWPAHAIRLYVYPVSAAMELRGATGVDTSGLAPLPAASWSSIPGKPGDITYFKRTSTTAVNFLFELLSA